MRSKSIVFINQNSGYLMIDVVNGHRSYYKERILLTGRLIERNQALDKDVKTRKIIAYDRSSSMRRIFTWTWGFLQILFLVQTRHRKADLYIVSNPPLAVLLPLFCRNRFSLLVFDVYPDTLIEHRVFRKNSLLVQWWKSANKKVMARASSVFTLSNGMKDQLTQYLPSGRIAVVPVWTDNSFLKPIDKGLNPFVQSNSLTGQFLVVYSGNLGRTHNLEVLLKVALKIPDKSIRFLIIGEGEKKSELVQFAQKNDLRNVSFLPWQPVEVLPYSLSAGDVGVVCLGTEASLLSVPSKTYDFMSVGAPLLCIADSKSELYHLVEKFQVGKCFAAGQVDEIVSYLLALKEQPHTRLQLSANSLKASGFFTAANAKKLIDMNSQDVSSIF